MARMQDRMVRAGFWNDPDLLRWPRDKRAFYLGIICAAEPTGCLEDDMFALKLAVFPSPEDNDINEEQLKQWRQELVDQGKLREYEAEGKRYLYIMKFWRHQTFRHVGQPKLPIPSWVHVDKGSGGRLRIEHADPDTGVVRVGAAGDDEEAAA